MIKNVIFDLGNVLIRFKPLEYVYSKIADESIARQVYSAIFLSKEWVLLDRGVITEAEAVDRIVARNSAPDVLIRQCMKDWYELLTPIEATVTAFRKIKAGGYKTLILSNYHQKAFEYISGKYGFLQEFDGGIISYRERLLKPEPEIYDALITRYRIKPAESVVIDDARENIIGAGRAGFATILVEDPVKLQFQLTELGLLAK